MTNRSFINMLIAKVIMKILTDIIINEICCMNCEYYFVNDIINDKSYCSIDKQEINPDISHIIKCKAFNTWFGVVD